MENLRFKEFGVLEMNQMEMSNVEGGGLLRDVLQRTGDAMYATRAAVEEGILPNINSGLRNLLQDVI